VFDSLSEIMQRLRLRLHALKAPVQHDEVTRALNEDAATHSPAEDIAGALPNDAVARRARAAADAALRARRDRR
jgi:hypothetical protein